jgi:hypothetical protein
MVCFKLYASVDHSGERASKHLDDLKALQPSEDELLAAARWTQTHDNSDAFLGELVKILAQLGVIVDDARD